MTKAITGTKTAAAKQAELTKRSAKPRGGKPGSAMTNQSAEYAEGELTKKPAPKTTVKSDVISNVKNDSSGGGYIAIAAPGHKTLLLKPTQFKGDVAKLGVVGGSYAAVEAALAKQAESKPAGKLANGITGRDAPHASKAVADANKSKKDPVAEKLLPKGKAAKADPIKPAKQIAKKAMTAPSTGGVDRKYKATKKEDTSKPDSFRNYMISTIRAHGSTTPAKEAHAASGKFSHERLNFKWAHDNGYIVIADLAK